jgi:putative ABC transport system permease protein
MDSSQPIRRAIYRKKFGAALIAAQLAITLAILSNAITLIAERLTWSSQSTGLDEANIFFAFAENVDVHPNLGAELANDLAALRAVPGVVDAYATNAFPLQGGGWSMSVGLVPSQRDGRAQTSYYFGDEHALNTLGLKLIAGRNFSASEIVDRDSNSFPRANGFIITRTLANKVFPRGDALGKSIYVESDTVSAPIIGIVDRLQGPFVDASGYFGSFVENSILAPYRLLDEYSTFAVRTAPGSLNQVMKAAEKTLASINGSRIITVQSMPEVRRSAYRSDRGLASILAVVTVTLVAVTSFGMFGLTSYWVAQRRRQIGIRRALGATRRAILRQFQRENLVIAALGAVAGIALSVALNLWLVQHFEMIRIDAVNVAGAALALILLGQMAVYWPARQAASISPVAALRGAQFRPSRR